jgi:hypothetical protein
MVARAPVILRRRTDTFERVIREHLRGSLFATEHPMDQWFKSRNFTMFENYKEVDGRVYRQSSPDGMTWGAWEETPYPQVPFVKIDLERFYQSNRVQDRVEAHIRTAPEREREALRRANIRFACQAR